MIIAFLLFLVRKMPCYINLATHDRLHLVALVGVLVAFVIRTFEKLRHTEHVSVVGNGYGFHSQLLSPCKELFARSETVENGILGVKMEMDE